MGTLKRGLRRDVPYIDWSGEVGALVGARFGAAGVGSPWRVPYAPLFDARRLSIKYWVEWRWVPKPKRLDWWKQQGWPMRACGEWSAVRIGGRGMLAESGCCILWSGVGEPARDSFIMVARMAQWSAWSHVDGWEHLWAG